MSLYRLLKLSIVGCFKRIGTRFCRLEEGDGPGMKNRWQPKNGWDKMEEYYKYLRERSIEYAI